MPRIWPRIRRRIGAPACLILCLAAGLAPARAQAIDPDSLTPRAAGTNLFETNLSFDRFGMLSFTNGISRPNSHFNTYAASIALAHYFELGGQPFELGVVQGVEAFDSVLINGASQPYRTGSDQLGLTSTTLFARYWPLVKPEQQAFVTLGGYLIPPDGTYSQARTINISTNATVGGIQIGGHKGFGANFSLDAAADVLFSADRPRPVGSYSVDPAYTLQLWANWDWTDKLRTSIGYAGSWGGQWYSNLPTSTGTVTVNANRSAEAQQIRAEVSYWWTPQLRGSVEVFHDITAPGGYQLDVGVVGGIKLLF